MSSDAAAGRRSYGTLMLTRMGCLTGVDVGEGHCAPSATCARSSRSQTRMVSWHWLSGDGPPTGCGSALADIVVVYSLVDIDGFWRPQGVALPDRVLRCLATLQAPHATLIKLWTPPAPSND